MSAPSISHARSLLEDAAESREPLFYKSTLLTISIQSTLLNPVDHLHPEHAAESMSPFFIRAGGRRQVTTIFLLLGRDADHPPEPLAPFPG